MNASELLALNDLATKSIKVREWKNEVIRIRELDLETGLKVFEKAMGDQVVLAAEDIAGIVVYGVVDKDNNPVFSVDDIPALLKKNRNALMSIYSEIMALTGDPEDARKNSKASQR